MAINKNLHDLIEFFVVVNVKKGVKLNCNCKVYKHKINLYLIFN